MCRVVRRVMTEAACTTQQKATVARRRCHVVVMIFVHGSRKKKRTRENSRLHFVATFIFFTSQINSLYNSENDSWCEENMSVATKCNMIFESNMNKINYVTHT